MWALFYFKFLLFLCSFEWISTQDYNVRDFGAVGDGVHSDTDAIRSAWAAAANSHGGRVIFDAGYTFLTAPFNLTSNGILDVRGTIRATTNESEYTFIPDFSWWGHSRFRHPVVFSYNASNITITGGGIIDGQQDYWINCSHFNITNPPCNGWNPSKMIILAYTDGIVIQNITLLNSAWWTLMLGYSSNIYINHINITGRWDRLYYTGWGWNNDGIDIVCSVNVTVDDFYYIGGDDAVMVKAGMEGQAQFGRPSENILVKNGVLGVSDGIGVGVEISAGARNITFQDIFINNSFKGINVQSERGMGGFIEDVNFYNITILNSNYTIYLSLYYQSNNDTAHTPTMKNVVLDNIIADSNVDEWVIRGTPESLISNLYLGRISITNTKGKYIRDCFDANASDIYSNYITLKPCTKLKPKLLLCICTNATVHPYCPSCLTQEACFDASSDCVQYTNLCNNPSYHAIMCDQCRMTCNLCSSC